MINNQHEPEAAVERRIPDSIGAAEARPGTKAAVLKHFGVFKDDADLEEQLAGIRAQRKAGGSLTRP